MTVLTGCQSQVKSEDISLRWEIFTNLTGSEHGIGLAGPVTGIVGEFLMVGGGANFPDALPWEGGKKVYHDEASLFSLKDSAQIPVSVKLPYPLAYPANCAVGDGFLYAGGENAGGPLAKVIRVKWINDQPEFNFLADLPVATTNASAVSIGDVVYLAGGETKERASAQLLRLDLNNVSGGWKALANIPHPVSNMVLLSTQDGKSIYLIGGRQKTASGISDLFSQVYVYHPDKDSWEEKQSLPYALSAGTGSAINEHTLALFGGDKGETFHKTELKIREINQEADPEKKKILEAEKAEIQSRHPGFEGRVLYFHIQENQWSEGELIPFTSAVTTTAIKDGNNIFIPSGEIRAGVRTPQILKGTILK